MAASSTATPIRRRTAWACLILPDTTLLRTGVPGPRCSPFSTKLSRGRLTGMPNRLKGSAARLRREAAKKRLLAHNTTDEAERLRLTEMAAMFEREAAAIDA